MRLTHKQAILAIVVSAWVDMRTASRIVVEKVAPFINFTRIDCKIEVLRVQD